MPIGDIADLLARCRNKEKEAWDAFVERYSRLIFWAIRRRLENSGFGPIEEAAKDIYQEVFLNIWQYNRLSEIKEPKATSTWLVIVAGNAAADYMRQRSSDLRREGCLTEDIRHNGPSPLEDAELQELEGLLERFASLLSERERLVWRLHLIHKKTTFEVSRIMSLSPNTVGGIIRRLKKKLRAEIKDARPVSN